MTKYDSIYLNSLINKNSLLKVFGISVEENIYIIDATKYLVSISEEFDVHECMDYIFHHEYMTEEELIINCLEVIRNDIKGN